MEKKYILLFTDEGGYNEHYIGTIEEINKSIDDCGEIDLDQDYKLLELVSTEELSCSIKKTLKIKK